MSTPKVGSIAPPGLARPSGFSHGVAAVGGARLHVAGQVGWDGDGKLVGDGFVEQFGQALGNVLEVVRHAGGGPQSVTRMRIYVTDLDDYRSNLKGVGTAYRERMGRHFPAMALVQVAGLLEPGARVEIEGTAVLP